MKLNVLTPIILFMAFSCQNDEFIKSKGLLLASDDTSCECCLEDSKFIYIYGKILRYRHEELPEAFQGFMNASDLKYPVPVELSWKLKTDYCPKDEILINEIKLEGWTIVNN